MQNRPAPMSDAMTRDPLPDGAKARINLGGCPVCHRDQMVMSSGSVMESTPTTRSVEPAASGAYLVQPHHPWCPVWSGETPRLACIECGAPVASFSVERGAWLKVPGAGPNGGPGHIEATPENLARYGGYDTEIQPDPSMDVATVTPCGHTLRGDDAREMARRVAEVRAEIAQEKATARIAESADLLAAARTAGSGPLADAYEAAVRSGSKDATGLLAAIKLSASL